MIVSCKLSRTMLPFGAFVACNPPEGPATSSPPTYLSDRRGEGQRHVYEHRRENGENVLTVLLDSVASQANRLESALSDVLAERGIHVPQLTVDFGGKRSELTVQTDGKVSKIAFGRGAAYDLSDIGRLTSLDVPHRVYDAIFRDSEIVENKKAIPFRESSVFAALKMVKPQNATALFGISPTALLFGAWDSTGSGGGLGAKFARSITSEIVGIGVSGKVDRNADIEPDGKRVGSRLDPLGIRADARVSGDASNWTIAVGEKNEKPENPSAVNHSNIPPTVSLAGTSVAYVKHTVVLTCAGLRRLKFPGTSNAAAGRAVLAALGLIAALAQDRAGYALRSRCDLVPDGPSLFEVVHTDGSTEALDMDLEAAIDTYRQAVQSARNAGFPWNDAPTALQPQEKLVQLVALSRARALAGEPEGDGS